METTQLYVELIIIGLETSIWMCAFFINIIGKQILSMVANILDNFASSLFLVGIIYIIGLIMDRFLNFLYQKIKKRIKNESGFEGETSILIWQKHNQEEYFKYAKAKIKILRASTLNFPLISISFICYIWNFVETSRNILSIYIFMLGILFTWTSWKAYLDSLKSYYQKARLLELMN